MHAYFRYQTYLFSLWRKILEREPLLPIVNVALELIWDPHCVSLKNIVKLPGKVPTVFSMICCLRFRVSPEMKSYRTQADARTYRM